MQLISLFGFLEGSSRPEDDAVSDDRRMPPSFAFMLSGALAALVQRSMRGSNDRIAGEDDAPQAEPPNESAGAFADGVGRNDATARDGDVAADSPASQDTGYDASAGLEAASDDVLENGEPPSDVGDDAITESYAPASAGASASEARAAEPNDPIAENDAPVIARESASEAHTAEPNDAIVENDASAIAGEFASGTHAAEPNDAIVENDASAIAGASASGAHTAEPNDAIAKNDTSAIAGESASEARTAEPNDAIAENDASAIAGESASEARTAEPNDAIAENDAPAIAGESASEARAADTNETPVNTGPLSETSATDLAQDPPPSPSAHALHPADRNASASDLAADGSRTEAASDREMVGARRARGASNADLERPGAATDATERSRANGMAGDARLDRRASDVIERSTSPAGRAADTSSNARPTPVRAVDLGRARLSGSASWRNPGGGETLSRIPLDARTTPEEIDDATVIGTDDEQVLSRPPSGQGAGLKGRLDAAPQQRDASVSQARESIAQSRVATSHEDPPPGTAQANGQIRTPSDTTESVEDSHASNGIADQHAEEIADESNEEAPRPPDAGESRDADPAGRDVSRPVDSPLRPADANAPRSNARAGDPAGDVSSDSESMHTGTSESSQGQDQDASSEHHANGAPFSEIEQAPTSDQTKAATEETPRVEPVFSPESSSLPGETSGSAAVRQAARPHSAGTAAWLRSMLAETTRSVSLDNGWKSVEVRLDDGRGTMLVRARRDDQKVFVSVSFSDPHVRALAEANAERIQETLRQQYESNVDFSLLHDDSGAPPEDRRSDAQRPAADLASDGTEAPEKKPSADRARITRAAFAGARHEWIG